MSKQIDFDNLDADDYAYLNQRPWLKDEYERLSGNSFDDLDFNLPDEDDESDESDAGNSVVDDFPTYTDKPRPEGWSDFSDDEKRAYIYDTGKTPVGEVEPNSEPTGGDADGDDDEDEVQPYSEWDYKDLKAEVAERGLEVADQKAETLVAALDADDEASETE